MNLRRAWVLLLASVPVLSAVSEKPAVQTQVIPGTPVVLAYRTLQPGEVLVAKLQDGAPIGRVVFRFLGQKRTLESSGNGSSAYALFGIDLGTKTGSHPLEITVERPDHPAESFSRPLLVEKRDFPSVRLDVAAEMVAPPPQEQERIRREQELIAAVLGLVSPLWLADGPFISPLGAYEPDPNFGQQRIYNKTVTSTHAGVDIGAPGGTPAVASNAGRVVLASNLYFSGSTVIIDHGLGVFTYCGHFSKILVKRGDLVKKGDVIALVGSTGRSTGPHLHWSVRIGPSRVDPSSLVALPLR